MLQHRAALRRGGVSFRCSPRHLRSSQKIGLIFQQNRNIAGLLNVQIGRDQRPIAVVHPYAHNAVAVGDKFSRFSPDDRGVGAVGAHARKVAHQVAAHGGGVVQEQRQTVLPRSRQPRPPRP